MFIFPDWNYIYKYFIIIYKSKSKEWIFYMFWFAGVDSLFENVIDANVALQSFHTHIFLFDLIRSN